MQLHEIPNIKQIAKQYIARNNIINNFVKNLGENKPSIEDIAFIEDNEGIMRGISFTILTILGYSTMNGTKQWLKEELEQLAK